MARGCPLQRGSWSACPRNAYPNRQVLSGGGRRAGQELYEGGMVWHPRAAIAPSQCVERYLPPPAARAAINVARPCVGILSFYDSLRIYGAERAPQQRALPREPQ
jgi:hypothetical protein